MIGPGSPQNTTESHQYSVQLVYYNQPTGHEETPTVVSQARSSECTIRSVQPESPDPVRTSISDEVINLDRSMDLIDECPVCLFNQSPGLDDLDQGGASIKSKTVCCGAC